MDNPQFDGKCKNYTANEIHDVCEAHMQPSFPNLKFSGFTPSMNL